MNSAEIDDPPFLESLFAEIWLSLLGIFSFQ